jgi:hypothetical protein
MKLQIEVGDTYSRGCGMLCISVFKVEKLKLHWHFILACQHFSYEFPQLFKN